MSRYPWTPLTVEQLLTMRAQGLMLSKIAAELGTTAHAVEHKLRRLRNQKRVRATAARRPLKLFDLRPHHCRWIVIGSGEAALFCGEIQSVHVALLLRARAESVAEAEKRALSREPE